jgi:DNA invertase Pin-like site-specific DNA recombinase
MASAAPQSTDNYACSGADTALVFTGRTNVQLGYTMTDQSGRYVAYYRVSGESQGRSGLGLEAQREAVRRFLEGKGWPLIAEFTEVETGKGSNALARRPQLREALATARKAKATLVIAKLDRLSRNVAFISQIMEAGVDFVAVDNPHATRLTLHILAAVAEHERDMISERTKAALAAAKARGTVLGAMGRVRGPILAEQNKKSAMERLAPLADQLRAMKTERLSVRKIAARLNEQGVSSPAGGRWHASNVQLALKRLAAAPVQSA